MISILEHSMSSGDDDESRGNLSVDSGDSQIETYDNAPEVLEWSESILPDTSIVPVKYYALPMMMIKAVGAIIPIASHLLNFITQNKLIKFSQIPDKGEQFVEEHIPYMAKLKRNISMYQKPLYYVFGMLMAYKFSRYIASKVYTKHIYTKSNGLMDNSRDNRDDLKRRNDMTHKHEAPMQYNYKRKLYSNLPIINYIVNLFPEYAQTTLTVSLELYNQIRVANNTSPTYKPEDVVDRLTASIKTIGQVNINKKLRNIRTVDTAKLAFAFYKSEQERTEKVPFIIAPLTAV